MTATLTPPRRTFRQANPVLGPCGPGMDPCSARFDATVATPRCCVAQHARLLALVAAGLDAAGVRWWIDYGMLLGYVTSGGFYWNDKDIDISVLAADRDLARTTVTDLAAVHGWKATYKPARLAEPWRYGDCMSVLAEWRNKAALDITFWQSDGALLDRDVWAKSDRFKGRRTPADWVFPVVRGRWEGVDVAVPREAERLVAYRYGPSWDALPAVRTGTELRPEDDHMRYLDLAKKGGAGPSENKAAKRATVSYASSAAEEAATAGKLTAADFKGTKPSGEKGYTKADVDAVIAAKSAK